MHHVSTGAPGQLRLAGRSRGSAGSGPALFAPFGPTNGSAGTAQRSRELVIEPHELQHLPPTAVVLCRDGPGGRKVILADANPAIMTLPTATLASCPAPDGRATPAD